MSNSELYVADTDLNSIVSKLSQRPISDSRNDCQLSATEDRHLQENHDIEDGDKGEGQPPIIVSSEELIPPALGEFEDNEDDACQVIVPSPKELKLPSPGDFKVDEEDDGFRTPTSTDHKIPLSQKCPLAPMKPKSRPMKRRKDSVNCIRLDFSEEIQSLFPTVQSELGHTIKKSRVETKKNKK